MPRTHEREILAPIRIATSEGSLVRDAVGFARRPLFDGTIERRFGRRKRWEYWCVTSPTHLVSLTLADLDYAFLASAWFVDLVNDRRIERELVLPPGAGPALSPRVGGDAALCLPGLSIAITEERDRSRLSLVLEAAGSKVEAIVDAHLPEGHETLSVLVPFDARRFQLTSKHVARPAEGRVLVDGREHRFRPADSFATLDFGRGVFPHHTRWNWSAGAGRAGDRVVGWNLGGRWTDGTGVTENALVVDGRLEKLGADARFDVPFAHPDRPWRIHTDDGAVELELRPLHRKQVDALFLPLGTKLLLAFGTFRGRLVTEAGETIEVRDLVGWAEDFEGRW